MTEIDGRRGKRNNLVYVYTALPCTDEPGRPKKKEMKKYISSFLAFFVKSRLFQGSFFSLDIFLVKVKRID
jgi:hypothetical protein